MYYVAFFKDFKNFKLHKEKFINNSFNSTQTFMCFYTSNPDSFDDDGVPNDSFTPYFEEGGLLDGVYRIQLKSYKGNVFFLDKIWTKCGIIVLFFHGFCLGTQNEVIEYVQRHRNIHQERRLRERPISDDEVGIEKSFEKILIPDYLNDDTNAALIESSKPLNILSDGNVATKYTWFVTLEWSFKSWRCLGSWNLNKRSVGN